MRKKQAEIIKVTRLKKDGNITLSVFEKLKRIVTEKALTILPLDCVYGIIGIEEMRDSIISVSNTGKNELVWLINSFSDVDHRLAIDKKHYDFLHRIWPGEVNVILKEKSFGRDSKISVRYPRSPYIQKLLEETGLSLWWAPIFNSSGEPVYNERGIIKNFGSQVDAIFIVKEKCREHTLPTLIDCSDGTLNIIKGGRVHSEEIKSLYFLEV